jgi:hypothetical protein
MDKLQVMKDLGAFIVLAFVWLVRLAIYIGIAYVAFAFLSCLFGGGFSFE